MSRTTEFDIVLFGATGFTGRLAARRLAQRQADRGFRWAIAGRDEERLKALASGLAAPGAPAVLRADATDAGGLREIAARAGAVLTTVGPYQLLGTPLVEACVGAGADYLDLSGEAGWLRTMIERYEAPARRSGARILFSCGFDSIPSELGVFVVQQAFFRTYGRYAPRVKGRMLAMRGELSGGTMSTGRANKAAAERDPALIAIFSDPFALTPGFRGPEQPALHERRYDPDVGAYVSPFRMAGINSRAVHRSNMLLGLRYGRDFQYDEMAVEGAAGVPGFDPGPPDGYGPGEGPSDEACAAGFYEMAFIARGADDEIVRATARGEGDPGYGSTSRLLVETALCLMDSQVDPGLWTPGAALGERLVEQLATHAGLSISAD